MDTKKMTLVKGKENLKVLLDLIGTRTSSIKGTKGKEIFSNLSKNLKDNIKGGIHDTSSKATEFFNSFKKDNIRNLEKLLRVEKSQLIVTSKKNFIYKGDGDKMVIIDRDMWGEPASVTIKENNKVIVKTVKFFEGKPFLFPVFNEKNLLGRIINMDAQEIWYQDANEVTILTFKSDKPDTTKVKIGAVKHLERKDLLTYVRNYKTLLKNKKLYDLVFTQKGIHVEDIMKIRPSYLVSKNSNLSVFVMLLNEEHELIEEFSLQHLPQVDDDALDVLLSVDILQYIRTNGYQLENFRQNDNYIEYWQDIGNKRVCVMRYKV